MEIVTWVLDGELEHRDSIGTVGVIYPGLAQRMSAGSGITHSEMNASQTADVHLVQMWVLPDTSGIDPSYEQLDVNDALAARRARARRLRSGPRRRDHDPPARRDALRRAPRRRRAGHAARLAAPARVRADRIGGSLDGEPSALASGDAARVTDASALALVAGDEGSEILVWATA